MRQSLPRAGIQTVPQKLGNTAAFGVPQQKSLGSVRGRRKRRERAEQEASERNIPIFSSLFFDCLAAPGKKKVWNWVSYLEAERMPAAPLKLFREVGSFFHSLDLFFTGTILELLALEVGLELPSSQQLPI